MQFPKAVTILMLLNMLQATTAFVPTTASIGGRGSSSLRMAIDDSMMERLNGIRRSYQALTERLADPDVINDSKLLRKVMSDRSSIEETVTAFDEYCQLQEELEGAKELFQSDDADMKEMAREEIKRNRAKNGRFVREDQDSNASKGPQR